MTMIHPLLLGLLLLITQHLVHAADIYGYVGASGVAHFAAEKLDARYQLFFRDGQSFDTAEGLGSLGRASDVRGLPHAAGATVSPAAQTLVALFEASPKYRITQAALRDAARSHAIDYDLLQALMAAESGFDAQAVSPKGAIGLMQLMPATAQRFGVQADPRASVEQKLLDPRTNIAAGARYLAHLVALFPGQIELALAAYNAGEGAVHSAGGKVPNYRETQNYVRTVLQLHGWLKPWATHGARAPRRIHMELDGAVATPGPSAQIVAKEQPHREPINFSE